MWDEPEEWAGRGRPDWHPRDDVGSGTRRVIASHRDTGEHQRVSRWMDMEDGDRARRRAQQLLAEAEAPRDRPVTVTWPDPDPVERLALWLDICKSVVAIVALLALVFFSGYAIVHGGWPIRLPGG